MAARLLIFLLPTVVVGFRSGAPESVCRLLTPNPAQHGARPMSSEPRHRIHLSDENNRPVTEYSPGSLRRIKVELVGPAFQGLLLQARSVVGARKVAGTWLQPLSKQFKFLNCSNQLQSSVTHSDHRLKQNPHFWWRPPAYDMGAIQFLVTVVQSRKEYWPYISSLLLYPQENNLDSYTVKSCGRGIGCLHFGKRGCKASESCNFTLSWKCGNRGATFEIFGTNTSSSYLAISPSKKEEADLNFVACRNDPSEPYLEGLAVIPENIIQLGLEDRIHPIKLAKSNHHYMCRFHKELSEGMSEEFSLRVRLFSKEGITRFSLDNLDLCSHSEAEIALSTASKIAPTFAIIVIALAYLFK